MQQPEYVEVIKITNKLIDYRHRNVSLMLGPFDIPRLQNYGLIPR